MKSSSFNVSVIAAGFVLSLPVGHSWSQHPSPHTHASPESAHQTTPTGPGSMKVEFENEAVLVLRIRMAAHEQTPAHDVSARLVVWLTDARLRDTFPDGRSDDIERAPGAVDWIPAQRHAGENLSDKPIEFLAIVPKAASLPHSR